MNWEAIGAVGEVLGAIGVILTLGYLAVQIRQNTRTVRGSTQIEIVTAQSSFSRLVTQDQDIARIIRVGTLDLDQLDPDEQARFAGLMAHMFANFEAAYLQHEQGLLDDDHWEGWQPSLEWWTSLPGVVEWFRRRGSIDPFSTRFREFLRQRFESAAKRDP